MMRPRLSSFWQSLLSAFRYSIPYSPLLVWVAVAWSVCLGTMVYANSFGYYSMPGIARSLVLAPAFFVVLAWLMGGWILPPLRTYPRRLKTYWILTSLLVAGVIVWHYPPAEPALPAQHVLEIYTSGRKNAAATGYVIEVQKLRYLDGQRVALEALDLTGEWNEFGDQALVTDGKAPAALVLRGEMAGGVAVALRYNQTAGVARVFWDSIEQELDLYSEYSTSFYTSFTSAQPAPGTQIMRVMLYLLFFSGLAFAILLVILLLNLVFRGQKATRLALALSYLVVFSLFLSLKLSYHSFNDVRNLRDTYSYVAGTDEPLDSAEFWMGERTFTVPLFLKLAGVNTQNYTDTTVMWRMALFQTWFSVFCWTFLASVVALKLNYPWLGVLGFAVVLFFSANQEISMWDTFLLSESLSFALFAWLAALWLVAYDRWFTRHAPKTSTARSALWKEFPWLLALLLATVLFSFARDVNLYFILVGSIFLFGWAGIWLRRSWRLPAVIYLALVLCLFVFQTSTVSSSGRWQIHVYDHLARRLLLDPQAVDFLRSKGLPIDNALLQITAMTGPEYRLYLESAPEMAAVRAWMAQNGRSAILGYLAAYPLDALLAPLAQIHPLLNGNSLEYRYPKDSVLPVPVRVQDLTEKYYPHQWPGVLLLAGLAIASLLLTWKTLGGLPALGWLILVLWVTVYPLMFIVWHGNPLEIERHATQIGIQVRLAGWLALLILAKTILAQPAWGKFWLLDARQSSSTI